MTVANAKAEYNKLLRRFNKANEYFERKDISNQEKEKQLENFETVLNGLNYYLDKISIFTEQEVLEGMEL